MLESLYSNELYSNPQNEVITQTSCSLLIEQARNLLHNRDKYKDSILTYGIEQTWDLICSSIIATNEKSAELQDFNMLDELYEYGLALNNKSTKKTNGQYYTVDDVAQLLADFLYQLNGENVCDVACGTGKLIRAYFEKIGTQQAEKLINDGKVYLYDNDIVALKICKTILIAKYGDDCCKKLHIIAGDFLNESIVLPKNSKIIANPPYAKIDDLHKFDSDIIQDSKELYAAFIEKIVKQSNSSVIISPYSFLGGNKFYTLRKLLNCYNGVIFSFDNVPGNIFCGKKHGVFNSNNANSVRAAITVVQNLPNKRGFRVSPLIRFKNSERNSLLKTDLLTRFLSDKYQVVSNKNSKYCKCNSKLESLLENWEKANCKPLSLYTCKYGEYVLYVPTTCRYFTVAYTDKLSRCGQTEFRFATSDIFNFVYCLFNSSFAYWYWRMYDGGINFTKQLMLSLPLFFDKLTDSDKTFFAETAKEMKEKEKSFVTYKQNKGKQENIKYPIKYRQAINQRLITILQANTDPKLLEIIHSNTVWEQL